MSGTISVPNYSLSNLVPGIYFSVDASNANTASANQRTLIIGQKITAGSGYAPNTPIQTVGINDVAAGTGGSNSMLARMVARYRQSDPLADVWVLPLIDDPAATASVYTVTLTGPATAAGTLSLMIAGIQVNVGVSIGDTLQVIATGLSARINQIAAMPVTASLGAGPGYVVTLTANNAGAASGDVPIFLNYYGPAGGQQTPAGVTVTIAQTTVGTANPSTALATALANVGNRAFDFIVCPYTDTASLNLISSFLNLVTGRWSWQQQIYGAAFTAFSGTVGQRTTFSAARNDQFISCIGALKAPNPAYEWAADYAGACALSLRADPTLPLGGVGDGVHLTVLPPLPQYEDTLASCQTLLSSGVSTYIVDPGGIVRVQRAVNLYTLNAIGEPDNSFRDVETNFTLMAAIRDMLTALSGKFGRKSLVVDGTVIAGGSNQVTSQTVLQSIVARYRVQCSLGLCQNPDQFAKQAQAINAGNGTVTAFLPFQVANQLRVLAGSVSFSKP